jgi:hypothetical protein
VAHNPPLGLKIWAYPPSGQISCSRGKRLLDVVAGILLIAVAMYDLGMNWELLVAFGR